MDEYYEETAVVMDAGVDASVVVLTVVALGYWLFFRVCISSI